MTKLKFVVPIDQLKGESLQLYYEFRADLKTYNEVEIISGAPTYRKLGATVLDGDKYLETKYKRWLQ